MLRVAYNATRSGPRRLRGGMHWGIQRSLHLFNLEEHVESIKSTLKPPVANKLIFDGKQLKVMIVGGPNQRDDFHIEDGEELFFQLKGGMNLDVMEDEKRKRVSIKEGDFLHLPSHVPHSPQRYADTVGMVIERGRVDGELDTMRWHVPGTAQTLYEESFHCTDLGTQLKPVIERFFASDEYKKHESAFRQDWAYESSEKLSAIPIQSFIENPAALRGKHGARYSRVCDEEFEVSYLSGKGDSILRIWEETDVFLWLLTSSQPLDIDDEYIPEKNFSMKAGDVCFIDGTKGTKRGHRDIFIMTQCDDSCLLVVTSKAFRKHMESESS